MLLVNLTYEESQYILHALRDNKENECSIKIQGKYQKASDKIKKAIDKKGIIEYHQEGKEEENNNREEFRLADMIAELKVS